MKMLFHIIRFIQSIKLYLSQSIDINVVVMVSQRKPNSTIKIDKDTLVSHPMDKATYFQQPLDSDTLVCSINIGYL